MIQVKHTVNAHNVHDIPYSGNVWRGYCLVNCKIKEIDEIKFGELIDFIHKDAIYKLNFGWLKFGEPWLIRQFAQLSVVKLLLQM